jgi:hypothetical protein
MRTKRLMAVALAGLLTCAVRVIAKSSSHSSTHNESGRKTVYVHSYTKKDGTHVSAHYRRAARHGGRQYRLSGGRVYVCARGVCPLRTRPRG